MMDFETISSENTEITSTLSSSVTFTPEDVISYLINYEWTSFKKFKTIPASHVASLSENNNCVCRCKWRHMFHGINLCLFTRNKKVKTGYVCGVIVALLASAITTWMVVDDYMKNQTATLLTIRQYDELQYPNITICPKYPDALNMSLVLSDIHEKVSVTTELNSEDINNLIAFALTGAGFDNFQSIVDEWDSEYIDWLSIWFRKWQADRDLSEFYSFLLEEAGFRCQDLFLYCYYAGDEIPCCDIFRFSYVMLRGRCLKLRKFYQEDPAVTGTITLYMRYLPSNILLKGDNQPQAVLYVSDEYPDVSTFPKFYMVPLKWNQLRLERQTTSMLPNNPHCSNSSDAIGVGTCMVNTWLRRRVVEPFNCTVFYLKHKYPNLPVCPPEEIVRNYDKVVNLTFGNGTQCLRACFRRETKMNMQVTAITKSLIGNSNDSIFHLEFAYKTLQEIMFEEVATVTIPEFISQISGDVLHTVIERMPICVKKDLLLDLFQISSKYKDDSSMITAVSDIRKFIDDNIFPDLIHSYELSRSNSSTDESLDDGSRKYMNDGEAEDDGVQCYNTEEMEIFLWRGAALRFDRLSVISEASQEDSTLEEIEGKFTSPIKDITCDTLSSITKENFTTSTGSEMTTNNVQSRKKSLKNRFINLIRNMTITTGQKSGCL